MTIKTSGGLFQPRLLTLTGLRLGSSFNGSAWHVRVCVRV